MEHIMARRRWILGFSVAAILIPGAAYAAAVPPVTIRVDASDAPRRIIHAKLTFPASPGPLTLLYPKWIPGEHGPTGPITDLTGLKFAAGGNEIAWRRDSTNMYAFHVDVPKGASSLEVDLDLLSRAETEGFSSGASASAELALVSWNQLLLYPEGAKEDELLYDAAIRLPKGWKYGTALTKERETESTVEFAPVSLTTLVDSPVLTGAYFRVFPLGSDEGREHEVDVAADAEADLAMTPGWEAALKNLVPETKALFGARHYRHYSFLLTLSDHVTHFGLEHHESSDDRVDERTFLDDEPRLLHDGLLTHEMVHSWNGKYRRPAGLMPGSFDQAMQGDLLWVYEGLTNYLGHVLAARSGLATPDRYRDLIALQAAELDHRAGRQWRPLSDTAVAAQILYGAGDAWSAWRRGVDYYSEGDLIWLEADTVIRDQSKGKRSLDDFCRKFFGPPSGPPEVKTYTFDDMTSALNEIAPHDWKEFFTRRLESKGPHAPLAGLEASGWRLGYSDVPSERLKAQQKNRKMIDVRWSIGLKVGKDTGEVIDAPMGLPAYKAGIGPGMVIAAVNRRQFSAEVLIEAIRAAKSTKAPIDLLVVNTGYYTNYAIDYHDGEKYPRLEPIPGKNDLLGEIIRAHRP
jgi:predicted metalloprotease with PDZ domain